MFKRVVFCQKIEEPEIAQMKQVPKLRGEFHVAIEKQK